MIRLFEQHVIRPVQELDGMWDFHMEGSEKSCQLPVPGCWEQHPDFLRHRGRGTYRKRVYIRRPGSLRLEFKGVSHTADVFFDGTPVAHHYNAFTPFSAILPKISQGWHSIEVKVDNTFSEASALHLPNDYYTYGGITRPVSLEYIPDAYIRQIHFLPYQRDKCWCARIRVFVHNVSDHPVQPSLSLHLTNVCTECGDPASSAFRFDLPERELAAGEEAVYVLEQAFPGILPWSHEEPNLYYLNALLSLDGGPADDLTERVGFRTVGTRGARLLVNGREVFLKGFNRHEDYAAVGCAIPLQLMVKDMDLMQDMGVNALRTCHYPNDERFLDLCDERGILVWEENHARGLVLKDMQNPNFDRQCEDCIREMIENHYNHPSIIIWGILNECASETEEGREKYARQYAQIRSLDASRPTTSATCRHFNDICLDLPDIVSFNLYSGWYEDVPVDERNRKEIDWIKASGGENKPIIVSEFGAGAIYGYREKACCKWSEEYQAELLRECLAVYMNDSDISGVFIWQFADCRVTQEGGWFASRARSHNNKGVVDEYRRPKLSYDTVKEMYRQKE